MPDNPTFGKRRQSDPQGVIDDLSRRLCALREAANDAIDTLQNVRQYVAGTTPRAEDDCTEAIEALTKALE